MPQLSAEGKRTVGEVAARHGVTAETAESLMEALATSGGSQAQFSIPELGGMGQWSRGGMVMVGDMFNNGLKARVDALCTELADLVGGSGAFAMEERAAGGSSSLFVARSGDSGSWWPAELGSPASVGAQNDMRYAFFPASRRLAIELGGKVSVYDTGDHRISGFSQRQSGDRSLTLSSQHGLVRLSELAAVGPEAQEETAASAAETPDRKVDSGAVVHGSDIVGTIERLADLHGRGILSEGEFQAKKAELLARL